MSRALIATAVLASALTFAAPAGAGIAEIRDSAGHLVASAGQGSYSSLRDAGWTLRIDSATRTARAVELRGVSIAGGAVYAERVRVPAHGLRGARIEGLAVNGKPVAAHPNALVPLGRGSYLVVLQEAVVPGEGSGVVGLRLVAGDSSLGLDPGTQLLIGLARAARPAPAQHQEHLSWLALGVSGQGSTEAVLAGELPSPFELPVPTNGTIGSRAVLIAERYLGVPYLWGGDDPLLGFDCSGLTMYVYAQLGISLAHYTGSQFYEGAPVPPADLQPGDLVFFEPSSRGPQHVGMYIGNGDFIQAPHTGDVVKISSLAEPRYARGFVGAVRPGVQ